MSVNCTINRSFITFVTRFPTTASNGNLRSLETPGNWGNMMLNILLQNRQIIKNCRIPKLRRLQYSYFIKYHSTLKVWFQNAPRDSCNGLESVSPWLCFLCREPKVLFTAKSVRVKGSNGILGFTDTRRRSLVCLWARRRAEVSPTALLETKTQRLM